MKNYLAVLCLTAFIFSSCKKNNDPVNPDEVRLVSIATKSANGQGQTDFQYDANGRITKVTSQSNTVPAFTVFDITYNSNQAILVRPAFSSAGMTNTDTIRLVFDQGRLINRFEKKFEEYFPPSNDPQRTYTQDTTTYEYNSAGLLLKEIKSGWDSTWRNVSNSGIINTSITRTTGSNDYTLSGNNVMSSTGLINWKFVTRQGSQTVNSSRSSESSFTYQYAPSFANKTDFSNAAIINEVQKPTEIPLNKFYPNLPSQQTSSYTDRAQNGSVISTNTYTMDYRYTYNSYGFVSSFFNPATPDLTTTFIYNK